MCIIILLDSVKPPTEKQKAHSKSQIKRITLHYPFKLTLSSLRPLFSLSFPFRTLTITHTHTHTHCHSLSLILSLFLPHTKEIPTHIRYNFCVFRERERERASEEECVWVCVFARERERGKIIYQSKRDLSESGYEIELTRHHLRGRLTFCCSCCKFSFCYVKKSLFESL